MIQKGFVMKFHIINQQVECVPNEKPEPLFQMKLTDNMDLFYVIQRFKRGRSKNQQHTLGDNCPFLYGLKQLDGLSVASQYQSIFYQYATRVVQTHFQSHFPFDYIVLLPSSHGISQHWVKMLGYDVPIVHHILRKKTNGEIKQEINQLYVEKQIDRKIHHIITQNCMADDDLFSLKNIPVPYREWIKPFALSDCQNHDLKGKSVLLVDDICSSGASLLIAANLLQQHHDTKSISALTLFGKVPK